MGVHKVKVEMLFILDKARGQGIGKLLSQACIDIAKAERQEQLLIHSTKAMQIAWSMYEKLGFQRSEDLDFKKGELPIYGFRLLL